jgi:hypothetical protein
MAESSPILTNFTSGELSPRLNGRIDMEKYYNGASKLSNFAVLMHGGLQKRSGTKFVREIKTSTGSNSGARLIPFVFSKTQAYILEFGHNYIRFYKDEGVIVSSGTTPYEISTTYTAAQINELEYVQSADVLYLVHEAHPPRKLSRTGHTSWTISDVDFFDGPYEPANTSSTTMQPSGTSGNITITASSSVFVANDVGRSIRIKNGSDWGFAKITGYNSATNVNATVNADMPFAATSANEDWRLGSFYIGNYPTKVTFFEERLFYAGTTQQPSTVFSSMSADFDKFSPTSKDGSVNDDNGLQFTIVSDQVNQITGLYGGKFLAIFTKNGAFNMSSGSATQGITPTTIQVTNETNDGAADKRVSPASKSVLFIGKNKKRLREFAYNIDYDSFTTPDMTVLSEHLGYGLFEECAFANYPNNILWVRRNDGMLLGFTYYRDQDVTAWHTHTIAGTSSGCTITVTDYANIAAGKTLKFTKSDGSTVTFTATTGTPGSNEFKVQTNNNTTADNIYTTINGHADFVVANPAANVVTVRETNPKGPMLKVESTDTVRLATTDASAAKVKSIAVIPGIDDAFDTLYMIVERTINGAVKQYVEFLEDDYREADGHTESDQFYVDSGLTYTGSSTSTVSGLDHLEGEIVAVLNNGAVESRKTVSSGAITLSNATTKCHVGLPFTAELESVNVEPKSQYGTTQGKRGRIDKAIFRLFETPALKAGPASSSVEVVPFRTTTSTMSATKPKTGDYTFSMPAGYTTENKIYVKSDTVQACTISAIMIQMSTYS